MLVKLTSCFFLCFVTSIIFSCSSYAADFGEKDVKRHNLERQAFFDWYYEVDVENSSTHFEEWYAQADPSELASFTTIKNSYNEFIKNERITRFNGVAQELFQSITLGQSRAPEAEFVSYATPRFVSVSSTLSIGQALNHDEIQVIAGLSDNSQRRKFLKMTNLGIPGQKPKLVKVNQKSCHTCHQNGSEHFSAFPWSDTTNLRRVADHILNSPFRKNDESIPSHLDPFPYKLSSLTRSDILGIAARVDFSVRRQSSTLQSRRVCEKLCGDNTDCRRALVLLAAASSLDSTADNYALDKILYPLVKDHWPEHRFSQPSSVLPSFNYSEPKYPEGLSTLHSISDLDVLMETDSLTEIQKKSLQALLTPFAVGFLEERTGATNSFTDQGVVSSLLRGDSGAGRAAVSLQRPQVKHLFAENLFSQLAVPGRFAEVCFPGFNLDGLGVTASTIVAAVVSEKKFLADEAIAGEWPKSGPILSEQIKDAVYEFGQDTAKELTACSAFNQSDEGQELAGLINNYLKAGSPPVSDSYVTEKLEKTCSQCHDPDIPESYVGRDIGLKSENMVTDMARYKDGLVIRRLECNEMPLDGALHYLPPDERAAIIHRLRQVK